MAERIAIPQLPADCPTLFPNPLHSEHPDGLIAWGGDLQPARLLQAYRLGIFPWFDDDSPILWWSPQPRAVFYPQHWTPPRRLARTLRQARYRITLDHAFPEVIKACAGPREGQAGTWITDEMQTAYRKLHELGHAHSIEVWDDNQNGNPLVGGLYGVAIGKIFFAESKFHRQRDASKIALGEMLKRLADWEFILMDCQVWNPHLERLGVSMIGREPFMAAVQIGVNRPDLDGSWADRRTAWP